MANWFFQLVRQTEHMDTQQWMLALIAAAVIGAVSLRGFGSRSKY